jgi:hypothetical protein
MAVLVALLVVVLLQVFLLLLLLLLLRMDALSTLFTHKPNSESCSEERLTLLEGAVDTSTILSSSRSLTVYFLIVLNGLVSTLVGIGVARKTASAPAAATTAALGDDDDNDDTAAAAVAAFLRGKSDTGCDFGNGGGVDCGDGGRKSDGGGGGGGGRDGGSIKTRGGGGGESEWSPLAECQKISSSSSAET